MGNNAKLLTATDVFTLSRYLCCSMDVTYHIATVLYVEKTRGNAYLCSADLVTLDDYKRFYDYHVSIYYGWEELVDMEYDLTESDCVRLLGRTIFPIAENVYIHIT